MKLTRPTGLLYLAGLHVACHMIDCMQHIYINIWCHYAIYGMVPSWQQAITPYHAELILGNKMYLYLLSFLNFEMVQVLETLALWMTGTCLWCTVTVKPLI